MLLGRRPSASTRLRRGTGPAALAPDLGLGQGPQLRGDQSVLDPDLGRGLPLQEGPSVDPSVIVRLMVREVTARSIANDLADTVRVRLQVHQTHQEGLSQVRVADLPLLLPRGGIELALESVYRSLLSEF